MILRPQHLLRFWDEGQHLAIKEAAGRAQQSVNEWLLSRLAEAGYGKKPGTGAEGVDKAGTTPGQSKGSRGSRRKAVSGVDGVNGEGSGVVAVQDGEREASGGIQEGLGEKPQKVKKCTRHRRPMKDFGNKWVCEGPPQHSEFKGITG